MQIVKHGFIDIENSDLKNLNILFGGRGLGKTYSILKHRIKDSLADNYDMSKFIWLRDSQEVVKKLQQVIPLLHLYAKMSPKYPK